MTIDQTATMPTSATLKDTPDGGIAPAASAPHSVLPAAFALMYATVLTMLPINAFQDRTNYLAYADYSDFILWHYLIDGWSAVFANEPLWLVVNMALASCMSNYNAVRVIIFLPAFVTPFVILRRERGSALWLIFLFLVPLVIKNNIIHLRQGVAVALFVAGYYDKVRWRRWLIIGLTPLVHSSFFFLVMIEVLNQVTARFRLSPWVRIIFFIGFFLTLGLLLGVLSASLGARQAGEYEGASIGVSGVAFAYWSIILAIFISAGKDFLQREAFAVSVLSFYLCVYFLTVVSGRIFESGLLFVLLAGTHLSGWRKKAFVVLIIGFTLANYIGRLNEPWLGWGV
ncbi:EpsG family protein [Sphingomonas sp. 2SG]|uniref:EpsG family protein n=1 Tax=Sphingomonas sp. 2SG TaxID=2502201 RepID=UPI0010F95083|nr:EpsG family protein [Sphingomonas sp. 2SG]